MKTHRIDDIEVQVHVPDKVDWKAFSDAERAAMLTVAREALLRLAGSVEDWLPGELLGCSEARWGFLVLWKNRHVDETIFQMQAEARRDSDQRLADLRRLAGR